jgi:hypothetical protein
VNDLRRAVLVQTVLEGVPLPAEKQELLVYARAQDAPPFVIAAVTSLTDRSYDSLDEVGEELTQTQPAFIRPVQEPRAESGEPPGGEAYVTARGRR